MPAGRQVLAHRRTHSSRYREYICVAAGETEPGKTAGRSVFVAVDLIGIPIFSVSVSAGPREFGSTGHADRLLRDSPASSTWSSDLFRHRFHERPPGQPAESERLQPEPAWTDRFGPALVPSRNPWTLPLGRGRKQPGQRHLVARRLRIAHDPETTADHQLLDYTPPRAWKRTPVATPLRRSGRAVSSVPSTGSTCMGSASSTARPIARRRRGRT